jgi:hypothetical protein
VRKTKGFTEPKGSRWVGGFKEWADGWAVSEVWVGGGMGEGMGGWVGLRVGFININDMYNNDVSKGGVRVYESHEVK